MSILQAVRGPIKIRLVKIGKLFIVTTRTIRTGEIVTAKAFYELEQAFRAFQQNAGEV